MSGVLRGIIQGVSGAASQAADRKYAEDQEQKKNEWSLYSKVAFDNRSMAEGGPTDQERQYAMDQIGKRGGKDVKQGLQKFSSLRSLIGALGGKGGKQQGQPAARGPLAAPASNTDDPGAPGQGAPAPAQATGQSRGMTEILPNGQPAPGTAGSMPMGTIADFGTPASMKRSRALAAPQFSLPAAPTDAQLQGSQDAAAQAQTRRNIDSEKAELDFWAGKGKDLGLDGRDLAQYAATKGQHLPPQTKRIADKGIARPGEDPSGKAYEGLWDHVVEPDGSETWAKRPESKSGSGFVRSGRTVTLANAEQMQKDLGWKFPDSDGNPLDISKVPPGMVLEEALQGNKIYYRPITPEEHTSAIGGKVYGGVTKFNTTQIGAPGSGTTELGPQRTGSTTLKTSLDFDPSGKPVVNTLPSTTQPATPGSRLAQPQSGGAPAPAAQPRRSGPLAPPAGAVAPAGGQPQASGNPPGTNIQGVPASVYRDATAKAVPLMESVTQVFGDPAHPEIKSLMGFADLADNPKSKERLGKALKLTFDGLSDATGGANVAVGAGPVNISAGGFGQWLQNVVGLPATIASQHADMMQKAVKDLTPEEREAYDAEMTAFSTAVGLRSLTKASAAQGSVRAIEREIPLIGVNTVSKKQFYDQMQRLAELSINGIRTFPNVNGAPVGFDKGIADRINAMPAELKRLKDATPQRGLGKPGSAAPTVRMKAPDGSEQDVPADQVEHYKARGATVVKKAA